MNEIERTRMMLTQAEANLAFFRSEPDSSYDDITAAMAQVATYSRRLQSLTFGQISGSSR
jgi:hypothetical protein